VTGCGPVRVCLGEAAPCALPVLPLPEGVTLGGFLCFDEVADDQPIAIENDTPIRDQLVNYGLEARPQVGVADDGGHCPFAVLSEDKNPCPVDLPEDETEERLGIKRQRQPPNGVAHVQADISFVLPAHHPAVPSVTRPVVTASESLAFGSEAGPREVEGREIFSLTGPRPPSPGGRDADWFEVHPRCLSPSNEVSEIHSERVCDAAVDPDAALPKSVLDFREGPLAGPRPLRNRVQGEVLGLSVQPDAAADGTQHGPGLAIMSHSGSHYRNTRVPRQGTHGFPRKEPLRYTASVSVSGRKKRSTSPPGPFEREIAKRVEDQRKALGLKQEVVARELGHHKSWWSKRANEEVAFRAEDLRRISTVFERLVGETRADGEKWKAPVGWPFLDEAFGQFLSRFAPGNTEDPTEVPASPQPRGPKSRGG
jgi:hypothetical protein